MNDGAGRRRARRLAIGTAVVLALAGMNGPWLYRFGTEQVPPVHRSTNRSTRPRTATGTSSSSPRSTGRTPSTRPCCTPGKVLLVAGSGNNQDNFDAKKFDTRLWDPVKGTIKKIPTPKDLFCTGHTQLAERQSADRGRHQAVREAEGRRHQGRRPDDRPQREPGQADDAARGHQVHGQGERQDLRLQGPGRWSSGRRRSSTSRTGKFLRNDPGLGRIYVEAQKSGTKYETGTQDNYRVQGLTRRRRPQHLRHRAEARPRQEGLPGHQGRLRVRPGRREVHQGRPDERGPLVPDADHPERRQGPRASPASTTSASSSRARTRSSTRRPRSGRTPKAIRQFPTYPALFLMQNGKIFYSGSNAGYGPDNVGRDPGVWDLRDQHVHEDARAERPEHDGDRPARCCCRRRRTRSTW